MPAANLTKIPKPQNDAWVLRLYVAGQTPNSITAFANLKKICAEHLGDKYRIELIDLLENPQLARGDQIIAIPTLVRNLPQPMKKIIGDLSNTERVLCPVSCIATFSGTPARTRFRTAVRRKSWGILVRHSPFVHASVHDTRNAWLARPASSRKGCP